MLMGSNMQAKQQDATGSSSTKFIQRLLIFYPELPTVCEGRIDESSSPEELTEHILYFHDENSPNFGTGSPRYATEEAIRFLGLCSALYTFPSTFQEADSDDDRSQEVKFEKSTLVFCPIEKGTLLAVIQVSSDSEPLAIRSSLQWTHGIFCLLRGGGVIPRLLSKDHVPNSSDVSNSDQLIDLQASFVWGLERPTRDTDDDMPPDISDVLEFEMDHRSQETTSIIDDASETYEDDGCIYAGMKSLYRLRKDARRKKKKISKMSSLLKLKRQALEEELEDTLRNLHDLYEVLPIASLRRELKAHYDEYLAEASLSNRCLVETVPLPIRPGDTSLPTSPTAAASIQLGHSIRALLQYTFRSNDPEEPLLVGISTFYKGSILYTHSLQDLNEDSIDVGISNQTASQIMRYMARFEQRMQYQPNNRRRMRMNRASSLRNLRQNLQESLQHFGHRSSLQGSNRKKGTLEQEEMVAFGQYLSSPPLSMLNLSDELLEIDDATLGNIWIPKFHVLVDGRYLSVQAALYSLYDYKFLVFFHGGKLLEDISPETMQLSSTSFYDNYFSPSSDDTPLSSGSKDSSEDEGQTPTATLLVDVSLHLSMCVNGLVSLKSVSIDSSPENAYFEPEKGLDIVFVDRMRQDVVIVPSRKKPERGLAKAMRKGRLADNQQARRDDGILATDLRHQLLSKFSKKVSDAFDDLMKEVHESAKKEDGNDIELCTYLPHGWVWASTNGSKELYLLFDSTIHSTVTEVQMTAERLRHYFFDGNQTNSSVE